MKHPGFFERSGPFKLSEVAAVAGAELANADDGDCLISDVRPLVEAGAEHATFFDNRTYLAQLRGTRAVACLVTPRDVENLPDNCIALSTPVPYQAFAKAMLLFYPQSRRSLIFGDSGEAGDGPVSRSAEIEDGVRIEPGAIVGPEVRIGRGTVISAGAVIGYRVHIGRDCYIGPNASVIHALVGDRVFVHSGVQIGQDGYGYAGGASGHMKVPQIGRVIIQDDVEIGANTTVDRGALDDTVIGEGTKIDNLVQIGHNSVIGRHCIIVAMTGISGSAVLEDFVIMGAKSGASDHVRIGTGAKIAGGSKVKDDVPPGGIYGGTPARPFKQWARELAAVKRLAKKKSN
jgi:UDP-3-O-[3-hydroxymyristoyl] glucosamine N-acyltransferase